MAWGTETTLYEGPNRRKQGKRVIKAVITLLVGKILVCTLPSCLRLSAHPLYEFLMNCTFHTDRATVTLAHHPQQ